MKLVSLIGLILGYFVLKSITSQLLFALPLIFILFVLSKPAFFPLAVLTTVIDDLNAFTPIGFHLLALSLSLLVVWGLKRFINFSRLVGLGLALALMLLVFIGLQAFWYHWASLPYLILLFTTNFIYGLVFISIYRFLI